MTTFGENLDNTKITREEHNMLLEGKRIQVIQQVRQRNGLLLKEAKDLVDAYCTNYGISRMPLPLTPKRTRDVTLHLLDELLHLSSELQYHQKRFVRVSKLFYHLEDTMTNLKDRMKSIKEEIANSDLC